MGEIALEEEHSHERDSIELEVLWCYFVQLAFETHVRSRKPAVGSVEVQRY